MVVLDRDGSEVIEWGGEGEGPGEFENEPEEVAVSAEGNVAVSSFRRVDVFTPDGILIGPHLLDDLSVGAVMFDRDGYVVAEVSSGGGGALFSNEPSQDQIMRLRDREVLRSFPQVEAGSSFRFFFPSTVTAALGYNRIATATNDRYEIDVLDSSSGRLLGQITRPVTPRETPEALMAGVRDALAGRGVAELYGDITFAETLSVFSNVFPGPPGRTVWVRRHIGIEDDLAPPVGTDIEAWDLQLYDLFDGRSYEYIGTVEMPEGLPPHGRRFGARRRRPPGRTGRALRARASRSRSAVNLDALDAVGPFATRRPDRYRMRRFDGNARTPPEGQGSAGL